MILHVALHNNGKCCYTSNNEERSLATLSLRPKSDMRYVRLPHVMCRTLETASK